MGQGGGVQLLNATKYDWIRTAIEPDSMSAWPFPAVIPPGTTLIQYVEFSDFGDDNASVTYALNGTGLTFLVKATNDPGYDIVIDLQNITTAKNPSGGTIDLGWRHNGDVYFFLGGEVGTFSTSVLTTASWMQDVVPALGERPLRHLCITGSHDAGMSAADPGILSCWTVTQNEEIGGQLNTGARYFDIRPVVAGGIYRTGHYTGNGPGTHGANGQTIQEIVAQVNAFTAVNAELIVLYLSHDCETDVAYAEFDQGWWNGLFVALSEIEHLYVAVDTTNVDLTSLTLNDFIGGGQAAVVVIVDPMQTQPPIDLGAFAYAGFYPKAAFDVINSYANTNVPSVMEASQYGLLRQYRPNPDASYFLLSWTLTQQDVAIDPCIDALAAQVNPLLEQTILQHCTSQTYPNILYTDFFFTDVVVSAMYVNTLASDANTLVSPPLGVALIGDSLTAVYRSRDQRLWLSSAGEDMQWSTPVVLPDTINSLMAPAVVAWNGAAAVLYRGAGTDATLWFAAEPAGWSEVVPLHETTLASPVLVELGGVLYGIFLASDGSGTIYAATYTGGDWNPSAQLPEAMTTYFTPAAAVLNGILYLLFRSSVDTTLWVAQWDGSNWSFAGQVQPLTITTFLSPSMTASAGNLYVAYRAESDLTIWVISSADGRTWSEPVHLPETATTLAAPAIVARNGTLYVLYASAAGDDTIWQTSSSDGSAWSAPRVAFTQISS